MTSSMRAPRRGAAAVTIGLATALLVPGPAVVASEPKPPEVEATTPEIRLAQAEELLSELRSQVDELAAANTELTEQNTALAEEKDALALENDQLQLQVDSILRERDALADGLTRFEDLYDPLEAERKLLLDLRKPIEDLTRSEAEQHIRRVRELAMASNPSGLGQLADRLGENAPAFLDWRDTEFQSTEEATRTFVESGASAFTDTLEEFEDRVLLSVSNRLDSLLNLLDRVR
jgi:chromosome segregation ATPase